MWDSDLFLGRICSIIIILLILGCLTGDIWVLGRERGVGMCLDCTGTLPLLSISLWFPSICLVVEDFLMLNCFFSSLVSL